jgi:CRISPR-associated protein Cas1
MKRNIYLVSGGRLKRTANTICFINAVSGEKKFVPATAISAIYVFGEVTLNKRLLEFVAKNEILLHFFNYYGYYVGSFYPRTHYNSGFMTLKQCEHYLDYEKRLTLAKSFVFGGLSNMLRNLSYYMNRGSNVKPTVEVVTVLLAQLNGASTIEQLMAIEGQARAEYYQAFNQILNDPYYRFDRREKRPPTNPINTLISFGNSLLYTTVLGEIYKTHLDPRIGYLHATNFRRFTLNLDVAEVFKPTIIDHIIFALVNKHILTPNCFLDKKAGFYLNNVGRKRFIEQYEKKLRETVTFGKHMRCTYQRRVRIELYRLEKHLMNEKNYAPFLSRW